MQEQQETAQRAHDALYQRATHFREASLDGTATQAHRSGDTRQLSASREALLAKLTNFQPLSDGSHDLDDILQKFHEVEAELARRGSPRADPLADLQLQRVRLSSHVQKR